MSAQKLPRFSRKNIFGLGVAGLANGINTSVGSGVAVATPAGSLSAGIGTSIGQSTGQSSAVAGPGGGVALSGAFSNNLGVGVGGGFTNVLP